MIVFVSFYAFPGVVDIDVVLLQLFQDVNIDWRRVETDLSSGQL